jgi:hypothetical protein
MRVSISFNLSSNHSSGRMLQTGGVRGGMGHGGRRCRSVLKRRYLCA